MNDASLFGTWLTQLGELSLVAFLIKLTILLGAVWIVHANLLRANPRWRVLTWRGAAIALLLMPLLHFVTPPFAFHVAPSPAVTVEDEVIDVVVQPFNHVGTAAEIPVLSSPNGVAFVSQAPPDPRADSSGSWSSRFVYFSVWCCGCLVCLVRTAVGLSRIRSLVRGSASAPINVNTELARVARELSVTTAAEVRVSTQIPAPILCGLFRKTLLIPTSMTEASRKEQRPGVFAHELAHVQSCDLAWNLCLHLITVLLWFHPLVWFARAVHAAACESVSDAVAAEYLGDVQAYSRTLARVALDAIAPPALSLAMVRASEVHRRVQALERQVFACKLSWWVAGVPLATGLLFASGLGGFRIVRAEVAVPSTQSVSGQELGISEQQPVEAVAAVEKKTNVDLTTLFTPAVQVAVNKALAFVIARQRPDGSFGGESPGQHDPAMTALCGMALLAAGSKPGSGPHGEEVQRVLDYLLNHVHDNGFIGIQAKAGSMYVHGYAVRFLAEVQLVDKTPRTEKAIAQAVDLIVKSQNARDGWRYSPNSQDADSSVTSCQVIALQAARRAGADVPQGTLDRALAYLKRCQTPDGGYSYVLPASQSALPRSAAAMAALYLSDVDDVEIARGLAYLNANATPPNNQAAYFYFTQFHLSMALRFAGGEHFRRWYEPCRDQFLKSQADDGSWSLQHYIPEYATAQACVVLLSPRSPILRSAQRDAGADPRD